MPEVHMQARDLHKTLGRHAVLKGLTLSVYRGETMVIMGGSGIGKTVTLKHFSGLMKPDSGEVFFEGRDITRMSEEKLDEVRRKMGFCFQNGALLRSMTVMDNIALPLREHTRMGEAEIEHKVKEMLVMVGLRRRQPEEEEGGQARGVESLMPDQLSGGMLRRAGLARALIRDPELILYDEPTAGLDLPRVNQVTDLIMQLQVELKTTGIVVSHDMPAAFRMADRVALLHGGRIIKVATPREFLEAEEPIIKRFVYGELEEPEEASDAA